MKTHLIERCPTCHQTDSARFEYGPQALCRCVECDTVYAAEYADPSEVYTDGYLLGETDFGIDVSDPQFQAYLERVGQQRAGIIERANGGPGSLLDVGCGTGELAAAAASRGWRVQGVEPEHSGAEMTRSRGVEVHEGLLEESGLPERAYNVVSAFHVLEHMPDSPAFLEMLARWAKPGGLVVVEMPNFRSVLRRRTGADWMHLKPFEHLVYHQPATLRTALERAGLDVVTVRTATWLAPPQTLDEALNDLGRLPLGAALKPFSNRVTIDDGVVTRPGRAAWPVLRGIAGIYDRLRVGMVLIGIARVPADPY